MSKGVVFIGEPLQFKKDLYIYPPKVKEVLTNPLYNQFVKIFTISQEDIEESCKEENLTELPTPFEFLLINCHNSVQFKEIAQQGFEFFTHQKVSFLFADKKLIVGELEKLVQEVTSVDKILTISEEEYFDFQNMIRLVCGISQEKPSELPNPNEDPRITAMKLKAKRRDRIKRKQQNSKGISIETCLVAICCMGIGITPLNIGEMSYAAIGPIMSMSQEKEKYDIDIRSLLAGADSKKIKPKYWIRNSDKD